MSAAASMHQASGAAAGAASFSSKQQKQLARMVTLAAIVALLFAQAVLVPSVEGRYLPTRSNTDQVRRQEIKEILRLLLDLPTEEQREWNGHSNMAPADLFELNPAARVAAARVVAESDRAKRDTSQVKVPSSVGNKNHQGPF